MKVRNRNTDETYDAYVQALDLVHEPGRYCLRYIIGIENWQGFNFLHACYTNEEFNEMYEVIDSSYGKYTGWMSDSSK